MRPRSQLFISALVGVLIVSPGAMARFAEGTSHWPGSISGQTAFQDLGRAITKDPGFPSKGSEVEKARFVFSRLPEIAKQYGLDAGSGGKLSDSVIGLSRWWGSDPEGADSLKGCTGWGNCGEWSYAFQEILGGAGVTSKVVYADEKGGTGHSDKFTGTDTTVIVEARTPDGAISRRVFDPFRAAYHGSGSQPTAGSVAEWGDRPLTQNDKLPTDAGRQTWQDMIGGKPFIKDATSQAELPPHQPIDVQERKLRERRNAGEEERKRKEEEDKRKAEEEQRRKAEEEARRKAASQAALKQAEALIAAARAAVGRTQAAIGAAKGAAAAGNAATGVASAAQGAIQQAKGAVDAARSACAKVVSEGVIDAARARAESAAGDVGALYQEAVDLVGQTCQAAGQVQKASNADARRILTTKAEALAARAQSRAASAQAALARARAEAAQAARQSTDRQAARERVEAARAAIVAAQGQVSAADGAMNAHEATVTSAQGQLDAARAAAEQVEQHKNAALGVLAPFMSEHEAQMMIPVINGVVAPSAEGGDQPLQTALTSIQQARAAVATSLKQLAAWEGSFATCDALALTDGIAQAAVAAASAAELFLPRVQAAAAQAAGCAGGAPPGGTPDTQGATQAGTQFQEQTPGGKPPGATSGATGGGQPVEQPGQKPPSGSAGEGTAAGSGPTQPQGQGVWCYYDKTQESYWLPMGPCPPPWVKPPAGAGSPGGGGPPVRVPWQGLTPPHGPSGPETPPPGKGGGGPCPPGCHIKPGTNKCHCGGN